LLIRRGVNSRKKAVTRKEVDRACEQCITLLSRPGGYGPAPNPSNTLLIRKGVDSGRQAVIEKGDRSGVWAICYSPEQARRESTLDPSNILLIRRGVNSGRKAATRKEVSRACGQCVILLSRSGASLRSIRVIHCLFVKALIQGGRLQRGRR
jgi:hypothetical protein